MSDRPGSIEIRPESLPIEPLPDVSWQRIERKLFAQLATGAPRRIAPIERRGLRPRTWMVAGGLAAAAAVAVVAVLAMRGDRGERRADQAGRSPSRIATAESPSAVSVGDVSLEIAPRSALLVDDDRDRGVLFVLERGEVTFRVAPVGDRPPVVVQAGDVRIEVVGTAFAVSREGDSARVVVYEGVVSLVRQGERSRLAAGSVWPSPSPPPPAPAPPAPPATPAIDDQPEPATPPPTKPPAAVKQPPPDRTGQPPALDAPRAGAKQRYQAAQQLEGSDPARALAIYADIASGGGAWAPLALYSQALLERQIGNTAGARKLLQRYLRRYPDGLNASDARELLDETGTK